MSKVIIESLLTGETGEIEISPAKDKYSTLSFDIIKKMGISPKIHRINGQKEYFCEGLIHPQGNNRPPITTRFHLVPSGNGVEGILVEQVFVEIADPFVVPWGIYLRLPARCAERLKQRAWEENKEWIKEQLEELGAEWILVCNREIIKWSNNLKDYPSQAELKEIAQKYHLFPFGFSQPPLIEDTSWYETKYTNDYYPTLKINIAGNLGIVYPNKLGLQKDG